MAYREREVKDIQVRGLDHPADLRPDPSKLPIGEELANLLEDINRSHHGLLPLHGKPPTYYANFGVYSRETFFERNGKVFTPDSVSTGESNSAQ